MQVCEGRRWSTSVGDPEMGTRRSVPGVHEPNHARRATKPHPHTPKRMRALTPSQSHARAHVYTCTYKRSCSQPIMGIKWLWKRQASLGHTNTHTHTLTLTLTHPHPGLLGAWRTATGSADITPRWDVLLSSKNTVSQRCNMVCVGACAVVPSRH